MRKRGKIEFFTGVQQFSQELLDWLDSDVPMDHSTLLAAFYAAEIWPYLPGMSTYHDLQSTGNLRLIDNIDLRTNLFRYYSPLRDDAAFRSILTYRHSELGVMLGLFRQQVAFADDVLDNM